MMKENIDKKNIKQIDFKEEKGFTIVKRLDNISIIRPDVFNQNSF